MFKFERLAAVGGLVLAMSAATAAQAGTYAVTVSEGLSPGSGFNTEMGNPYSGNNTASASFSYTGDLNFSDTLAQNSSPAGDLNSAFGFSATNISGYGGTGTVVQGATPIADFTSVASFLASSGSASNYQYGSYFTFDLGVLAAGTTLTVLHDDGISVFQGGTEIGSPSAGPTSAVTDVVTIGTAADTVLRYSRQNGTPSILQVSVPEPASVGLLGLGLLGLLWVRRTRSA